jgi:TRAP-type C4-dicarboxylate transport system permease small subunit
VSLLRTRLQALDAAVGRLEALALGLLVALLTVVTFGQVVFRYGLNQPLFWSDEAARYLFVWTALIGAAACVRARAHYAMDALVQRLPPTCRRLCAGLAWAAITGFVAVLLVYGWRDTVNAARQEALSLPMRMGWAYAAMPVGAALMLLHLVVAAIASPLEPDAFESGPAEPR